MTTQTQTRLVVEIDLEKYGVLYRKLEGIGDAREIHGWDEGRGDYLERYGITRADIPALIQIALWWAYRKDWPEDQDDETVWAPIHAWRMLGQLRAVEAVEPLFNAIPNFEAMNNDWFVEEFQRVFGMIGEPAYEPCVVRFRDRSRGLWERVSAKDGLKQIARRVPTLREKCVQQFREEMEDCLDNDPLFNAMIVYSLMSLDKEKTAAEVVERAYAADVVDEQVCGSWGDVRRSWGVEGLGIAKDHRRKHWEPEYLRKFRNIFQNRPSGPTEHIPLVVNKKRHQDKQKMKLRVARKQNKRHR